MGITSWPKLAFTMLAAASMVAGAPGLPAGAQKRQAAAAPHERLLPLEGGRNFRDLGGYRTADGRHVKWNMLYRSGSMHGLTDVDYATLGRRGIRVVCDFRDTRERTSEPVNWPTKSAPRVLSEDYTLDHAGFMPAGPVSKWNAASARAAMTASYPRLLVQFQDQYRRMFTELLAGHAPLAFNCTAGKDRTGVAAAVLLTALGVPRETVIGDYLLTNRYLDQRKLMKSPASVASPWAQAPPEVMRVMGAADRRYIEAALAVLDRHRGGANGWMRDKMALSHADIMRLRHIYLE